MSRKNQHNQAFSGSSGPDGKTSLDDLLGGAVRIIQPVSGYRVTTDTLLLAACVPAKKGEKVLEAGTGTGGAALCIARRVEGADVTGIEIQDRMAGLAEKNIALNHLQGRVHIVRGCITRPPDSLVSQSFDHVLANPPYLEPGRAIRPPSESKGLAFMESSATLKDWVKFCLTMARNRGTLSFIHRADHVDALIGLLYGRVGELKIFPLWPRPGVPAKRVIIQGRKGVHGVACLLPGIALHGEKERYSKEAEVILRHGAALDLRGG